MDITQKELFDLFYNLSVQLRTELHMIHTVNTQLVTGEMREADGGLDSKAAVFDCSYYRLLRLAENLEDTKYLTQPAPLQCQDADMVALVGDICANSQSVIQDRRIRFHCPVSSLIWRVNSKSVQRLLYHLISNALKSGSETVDVTVGKQGKTLELTVADQGCGMSQDQLDQALDVPKVLKNYTAVGRGLGLGLPIVNAIAQWHGGTFHMDSQPGQGTTMTVSLPWQSGDLVGLSDVGATYESNAGFNPTLKYLADVLPSGAFGLRVQDQ